MKSQFLVEVENLSVYYGETQALEDLSISLPAGRLVGVIGPNGAGKSTLIKSLVGSLSVDRGTIRILGQSGKRALRDVTYVPQRGSVDWDFPITAHQVVRQGRMGHLSLLQRFGDRDRGAVQQAMAAVGIEALSDRQIGELSGGQQQRVFLARALAKGGDVFLLDEPFAGVDVSTESEIIAVLQRLRDEGKLVIVVHHDLNSVSEYFDELVLLNTRLVAAGPTSEVFTPENLQATYGGQVAVFRTGPDQ